MRKLAPGILGRFGFVCALLMALAMSVLPIESQAFSPADAAATAEAALSAEPCDLDDCDDCGMACTHGCCHAAHVGIPASPPLAMVPAETAVVNDMPPSARPPLPSPSGLERPPRA